MREITEASLIRVFVGENDKVHGRPLYEAIVNAARDAGLAGASVLQGVMGYHGRGAVHTAKLLHLSEHLPMVVEIVDLPHKIEAFLPTLAELVKDDGLVTIERVRVLAKKDGGATAL
jgi:PII-like signaling protein